MSESAIECFLDTCIFMSYANYIENYSSKCEQCFNRLEYRKYTSETVIGELDRKAGKRIVIYKNLLLHFALGGRPEDFTNLPDVYINESDLKNLIQILEYFRKLPPPRILSQFRLFLHIFETRLKDAKKNILKIVPKSTDLQTRGYIQVCVNNNVSDAQIIMDAFEWSTGRASPIFVTIDITDIYKNKGEIMRTLINGKFLDSDPFCIKHIIELVG